MTDIILFANNAKDSLALSASDVATTLTLNSSASFPSPVTGQITLATLTSTDGSVVEIVKVTDNTANVLTVVRAQEGTVAVAWASGTVIEGRITAGILAQFGQGIDNSGNARGFNALDMQTYRSSSDKCASGYGSIAIGQSNKASGSYAIAIGEGEAWGDYSISLGRGVCKASDAVTISTYSAYNRVNESIMIGLYPVIPMQSQGNSAFLNCAAEVGICSDYIELGVASAWATNHIYKHGDIVVPSSPNGYQYCLSTNESPTLPTKLLFDTTGLTEPIWVLNVGGSSYSIPHYEGQWLCQNPLAVMILQPPEGTVFVPLQFGFLAHNTFSTLTGTPVVSVGVVGDITRYVNAQNVTITAANEFYLFTAAPVKAVLETEQLIFTLDTSATAGRCVGRFFVRGFFVELPDHA